MVLLREHWNALYNFYLSVKLNCAGPASVSINTNAHCFLKPKVSKDIEGLIVGKTVWNDTQYFFERGNLNLLILDSPLDVTWNQCLEPDFIHISLKSISYIWDLWKISNFHWTLKVCGLHQCVWPQGVQQSLSSLSICFSFQCDLT